MLAPNADRAVLRRVLPYLCAPQNLPGGRVGRELRIAWELTKARMGPYDLIYIQSSALGPRAITGVIGGARLRKKVVYQTYDYIDPQAFPVLSRLERAFVRRVDAYLNGEYHRALVCKTLYGYDCPTLIAPPVLPAAWPIPERNCDRRALMTGGGEDAFVLMLHGGFHPLRMVREIFEALARLPQRYRLVITSSGENEPLADALIEEFGIDSRVVRLGPRDFAEMLHYTVNADAGLLLYRNNDLGNYFQAPGRLTEYLACGLPVIATDHVGLENLVLKHDIGIATDSRSPAEIARAVIRLDEAKRAGRFSCASLRRTFVECFSFELYERTVCELFDSVATAT